MDKQIAVYLHNDSNSISLKKGWNTNACYNMGEPSKHAMWKKLNTKARVLYDSIYMNIQNR